MPILEAMVCSCLVITSSVTACPEVAGYVVLLVDPYSVDDLVSAMSQLVDDDNLRKKFREKGLDRAAQFAWKRSAEEHLKVFESVLRYN